MKINPHRLTLALTLALASPMALAASAAPEHHRQAETQETRDADRPDAWVVTKVNSKLAMSSNLSALDINVDVDDGVVTLRGTVDNRAQEEEALRLARETVGANEVRSALVINPNATDRQRDRNEMTPQERREDRQKRRQDRMEGEEDRNRMHRSRHDSADRHGHGHAQRNHNHNADRAHGDADRPDAWVVTKVKSKLAMSGEVSSLDINVDSNDGIVTLRGTVDNRAQEEEALRLARETVGANEVRSALVINPNATDRQRDRNEMTPQERREERQERRENRQERMERAGERDHMRARSMDRDDHDRNQGRRNRTTDTDMERPDSWLLTKVKSQMLASSDVGGLDINVDVDDGVVTLRGDVETQAEANEAVRIARSIEGVKRVNSHLVVSGD